MRIVKISSNYGPEYSIGLPPRRGRLVIQPRDPKSQEPAIEGLISILQQRFIITVGRIIPI